MGRFAGGEIGHKRIQQFARTEVSQVRFRATSSISEPHLRQLTVFNVD